MDGRRPRRPTERHRHPPGDRLPERRALRCRPNQLQRAGRRLLADVSLVHCCSRGVAGMRTRLRSRRTLRTRRDRVRVQRVVRGPVRVRHGVVQRLRRRQSVPQSNARAARETTGIVRYEITVSLRPMSHRLVFKCTTYFNQPVHLTGNHAYNVPPYARVRQQAAVRVLRARSPGSLPAQDDLLRRRPVLPEVGRQPAGRVPLRRLLAPRPRRRRGDPVT